MRSNSTGKADVWTKVALFGDSLESVLGNYYWGASLANLFQGLEEDETSEASMWVGFVFGLFAIGSVYVHNKQNLYHQHGHSHSHGHSHDQPQSLVSSQPLTTRLLDEKEIPSEVPAAVIDIATALNSEVHEHSHEHSHEHLGKLEKAALGLDIFTHAGDVSGAITAAADLISKHYFKNSFTFWQRVGFQAVSTVIGVGAGIANARNCKHSMEELNKAECKAEAQSESPSASPSPV